MTLLVVAAVGVGLIPLTVGVAILALAVPAIRWIANRHRAGAALLLSQPVPPPYRPARPGGGLSRLVGRGRDPQTWRDLLWLFVSCTLNWTLSLIAVSFFLAIPWYLIQPLLLAVTPEGVFDINYRVVHVESVADAFAQWVLTVPAFLLWWYVSPLIMNLVARIDRGLLGPTADARARMLQHRIDTLAST